MKRFPGFPIAVLLAAIAAMGAGPGAFAQVSPQSRAAKFWEIFSKSDNNGKALAFDVLSPADDPAVISMCFRSLTNQQPLVLDAACVFLASASGEKALEEVLEKGSGHKSPAVRFACARAFARIRDVGALVKLKLLLKDREWFVRAQAAESLGARRETAAIPDLSAACSDSDPRVKVVAAEAIGLINDLSGTQALISVLPDKCWQVRSASIEALRNLRPKAAFEPLVDRMAEEAGRLKMDARLVLVYLAGQDLGDDPADWREWWAGQAKKQGTEGRIEQEYSEYAITRRKSVPRKFFSVKTDSRRIVFILDTSASMNSMCEPFGQEAGEAPQPGHEPGKSVPRDPQPKEPGPGRPAKGQCTRFSVLVDQLAGTIESFDENVHFNVILFGSDVRSWKDRLEKSTPESRAAAIAFVKSCTPSGETNIFDALAMAFGASLKAVRSGTGYLDEIGGAKGGEFENGPDTVFLLSDGVPNKGEITDGDRIAAEISRANRARRIVVNTIAVGNFQADFLRKIAVQNWGHAASAGK